MKKLLFRVFAFCFFCFYSLFSWALVFDLPANLEDSIVGEIKIIDNKNNIDTADLIREQQMGYDEMQAANPSLLRYQKIPPNKRIIIPSLFVLPENIRHGIVINTPEKRLFYYPDHTNVVITEPVTIGKFGWRTPLVTTKIIEKIKHPTWRVPKSILEYKLQHGEKQDPIVPPGKNNPLGDYALRLSLGTILIHATNQPKQIGKEVSFGCVRMYPEDIEPIFNSVSLATPVFIINQPYKLGWLDKKLYLEIHPALKEDKLSLEKTIALIKSRVEKEQAQHPDVKIKWDKIKSLIAQKNGIPEIISE